MFVVLHTSLCPDGAVSIISIEQLRHFFGRLGQSIDIFGLYPGNLVKEKVAVTVVRKQT
jgi:hypothetical protein